MAAQGDEMPFWDHLEVLRGVIFRALGLIVVLAAVFFAAMPALMDSVILAPCSQDFVLYRWLGHLGSLASAVPGFIMDDFAVNIINIKLASQFFLHISLSFWMAVVVAFPALVYLAWRFVEPALLEREKRGARVAYLLGTGMFFLGVAAGYFLVFPLTLRFLAGYSLSDGITNQLSLDSYMDNFLALVLIMGVVFELPLVAWLLGKAGVLRRAFFTRYRRHAIVALLILAAVITPTGDPFTLMVVFLPVYLLWEMGAFLVPRRESEDEKDASPQAAEMRQ